MKQLEIGKVRRQCFALVAACSIATSSGNSANLRSSRAIGTYTDQRLALLAKLRVAERVAHADGESLREMQGLLRDVQLKQQLLQARGTAIELTEFAATPEHVVFDHGAVGEDNKEQDLSRPHLFSRANLTIHVRESEDEFWYRHNKDFVQNTVGMCFYVITMLIAGFVYIECVTKSLGEKVPDAAVFTDDFQYGAFDCNECGRDWQMCFFAWCCSWVRWADTASQPQLDFLAFWPALFITSLLAASTAITFGGTALILLALVVYSRQRIRIAYGLPTGTLTSLAWDCCLWCLCPFCALVQEARQVEYIESRWVIKEQGFGKEVLLISAYESSRQSVPHYEDFPSHKFVPLSLHEDGLSEYDASNGLNEYDASNTASRYTERAYT